MRAAVYHYSVHVSERDLIPRYDSCPLCSSLSLKRIAKVQCSPDVWLIRCLVCRAGFTSHVPTPELLRQYYANYYGTREIKATVPSVRSFAHHIVKLLKRTKSCHSNSSYKLLDFGGGDGSLICEIARLMPGMVDAVLVDYHEPRRHDVSNLRLKSRDDITLVEGDFDLIIASASLEHTVDLRATLLALVARLKSDGVMYARTPWIAPFMRVWPWIDFTFPGHLWDLGGDFWAALPDQKWIGLDVIFSSPSPIETGFFQFPLRTVLAFCLKLPSRLECRLGVTRKRPLWRWVGGWEVLLTRR